MRFVVLIIISILSICYSCSNNNKSNRGTSSITENTTQNRNSDSLTTIINDSKNEMLEETQFDNIEGTYYDEMCGLTLMISKAQGEYYYEYISDERKVDGKVHLSTNEDQYFILENMEYAEDYFDISLAEDNEEKQKEYDRLKKIGKRQVGIDCYYDDEEIVIQNYGNAMNYYVKLYDCGEKYIHLIKQ